jgi:hypothetical protein
MFDPTGQVRQIPADQATAALQAGGKTAVKIIDPTNTPRWIPSDQQDAALKAGGKLFDGKAVTSAPPDDDTLLGQTQEAIAGVKKGVNETGLTAMKAIHAVPGVGTFLDNHTKFGDTMKETQQNADAPVDTIAGKTGYALENIAEFMGGDEALKGLGYAEKLAKIAPFLSKISKSPRLMEALNVGIRQMGVGAGQAAAHGASAGDSATSGILTGVVGGAADLAFPALGSGMRSLLEKIRPSTTEIAGEAIPELASQKPGAPKVASKAATISDAPATAEAQQQGTQRAVTNIAQKATKDALEKVNAVRVKPTAITDPARLLEAPEATPFEFHIAQPPPTEEPTGDLLQDPSTRYRQTGSRVVEGKGSGNMKPSAKFDAGNYHGLQPFGIPDNPEAATPPETATVSHKEPTWEVRQYNNESAPGQTPRTDNATGGGTIVTTDPQLAQGTLTRLQDLKDSATFRDMTPEQQERVNAAHKSLQEQLGMYHASRTVSPNGMPNFEPVNIDQAIGHVTNFGEAADQIQASVKPIYQKLDDVSGGQFTALRNQAKAASKVMFQPGSIDAYDKALEAKQAADDGIQELFTRYGGKVNRAELTSANSAWRDSKVLDNLHATVEGSFKGAPKGISDSLGTNRILRGNTLESRLNRLLQKTPQADIERVIGKDGLENLYRVSNLLKTPETAVKTTSAARAIGLHILQRTSKGAVAGGMLGAIVGHPWAGAAIGAGAEDATRFVMRQAAINPRVGMMLDRAVRHNVNPKIFAPLVAAAIQQNQDHHTEAAQ